MGQFFGATAATSIAHSLNWMFDDDFSNTRQTVMDLRKYFPDLLNYSGSAKPSRKESLRFAAFLLNDQIPFSTQDPVDHNPNNSKKSFRKWLKWLTWIDLEDASNWTIKDGSNNSLPGTPGQNIRHTISDALTNKTKIKFSWNLDNSGGKSTLVIDKSNGNLWKISIVSQDVTKVNNGDSDEDDNP
jgi:hypothetical protein